VRRGAKRGRVGEAAGSRSARSRRSSSFVISRSWGRLLKTGTSCAFRAVDEYQGPIAAFWARGLGRVAAVTAQVDGDWGRTLLAWPHYSDFFVTLAWYLQGEGAPGLSSLRPTLPKVLCDCVAPCLRKDREDRYQGASALLRAVEAILDEAGQPRNPPQALQ
jgi:hypothetical protein